MGVELQVERFQPVEFCHVHRHSEFSPLDGTGNANQYAEWAATVLQHRYLGLTDHGTLGGALDHIRACRVSSDDIDSELRPGEKRARDERIKPVVGCEVFWVGDEDFNASRMEKSWSANVKPHLCLHASGAVGWHNLIRIVTESNVTGFHGVPRVDWDLLERYGEGIVASTACISSPLYRMMEAGRPEAAKEWLQRLSRTLGGRVWGEIMGHDIDKQRAYNVFIVNLFNELGLPLIATSDAHYFRKEWSDTQEVVFMMSRKDTFRDREEAKKEAVVGDEVYGEDLGTAYLMDSREMQALFAQNHPDLPESVVAEAIKNTVAMAQSVKPYVVSKDPKLPRASKDDSEAERTLRTWCEEGFERERGRRGDEFVAKEQRYREQLEFELDTLRSKGVMDYFVIVGDVVRWAKGVGIRVGPGRGSAAGCLLSYLVGITGMDPLSYDLLFERFLNPDRKGLPDIDVDFASSDRERVIQYLKDRWGEDHVANVVSYQTFGPKSTIGDIAKVFNAGPHKVEYMDVQRAKEDIQPLDKDVEKLVLSNPKLEAFRDKYPEPWKHMSRIDDMVKGPSKHASAIIIADRPIAEYAPLALSKGKAKDGSEDKLVVSWADRAAFPIISEYGLLKIDVLGLEELTKHEYACQLIAERQGFQPDIYNMPVMWDPEAADPEVMQGFKDGLTLGVFQFGSSGFTQLIRAIKPDTILDLTAANALYRPGAMEFSFRYAKRKRGEEETDYWHEAVVPFLRETYGLLAYQEQIMNICKAMGNFTPGQADDIRKAISKLYRLPGDEAQKFMGRFRAQWDAGCLANGISDEIRDQVWQSILAWGSYGFNKSHSASYALLAYIDMWLKIKHPQSFYAALLTHRGKLEVKDIVREAAVLGVDILQPDVNASDRGFTLEGEALRYGLLAVKNIGGKAANDIIDRRTIKGLGIGSAVGGKTYSSFNPYASFDDFLERQSVTEEEDSTFSISDAINLIKAGAFDSIDGRDRLLMKVPKMFGDQTTVFDVFMECGCVLKGRSWDPDDPYKRDDNGEVQYYTRGKQAGEPKMKGKMPYCKKHECDAWEHVDERREFWTLAHHMHKNTKLATPHPLPESGTLPSQREIADFEEEVLGLSLSRAKMAGDYEGDIRGEQAEIARGEGYEPVFGETELAAVRDKRKVFSGGEVVSRRPVKIKNGQNAGREMCFLTLAIGQDQVNCTVFSDLYERDKEYLEAAKFMIVLGKKDTYRDSASIIINEMYDYEKDIRS